MELDAPLPVIKKTFLNKSNLTNILLNCFKQKPQLT